MIGFASRGVMTLTWPRASLTIWRNVLAMSPTLAEAADRDLPPSPGVIRYEAMEPRAPAVEISPEGGGPAGRPRSERARPRLPERSLPPGPVAPSLHTL